MSDVWDGVKNIIGKTAPLLANAIIPGSGGVASGLISNMLGVENDPIKIQDRLLANPDNLLKLKELETKHEERLIELSTENNKVFIQDVQNARTREIEITKSTGKKDYNLYVLAWSVIIGFFVLCWLLMKYPLPEGSNEVVFMLFGGLNAGFATVLSYFFGSSKSSSDKTKLLTK